jgi:hypothetical protein
VRDRDPLEQHDDVLGHVAAPLHQLCGAAPRLDFVEQTLQEAEHGTLSFSIVWIPSGGGCSTITSAAPSPRAAAARTPAATPSRPRAAEPPMATPEAPALLGSWSKKGREKLLSRGDGLHEMR